MTVHHRRGKNFDKLVLGHIYVHRPGRTVIEADNVLFTTLTMNTQSSVSDLTEGTTVANLGFVEIRFPTAVFIGDTLTAETEVIDKRLSASRPGHGVVTFEHRGRNQRGETVCTARRAALVLCASPAAASSG